MEIQLKADIDSILRSGTIPEECPYEIQIIQESDKHNDKYFTVKVIGDGAHHRQHWNGGNGFDLG